VCQNIIAVAKPTIIATDDNLITVEYFSSPILFATGNHFSAHSSSTTKASPRFALIH
jgi:hypothetical protein